MRKDKSQVILLRKKGLSYSQIQDRMNIPKSTLSDWLSSHEWSRKIKNRLQETHRKKSKIHIERLNTKRTKALESAYQKAIIEANSEYLNYKYNPLFIAGLMLYWGEGDKSQKSSHVRLGNTDPVLLRVFLKFMYDVCGVEKNKIWASVHIYTNLEEKECVDYWSTILGVPVQHFHKSQVLQGRHKTKRLPYGTCTIGTSSTYLKKKALFWIETLSKDLLCDTYNQYDNEEGRV